MSTIPTSRTEKAFDERVRPYVSVANRGYECSIPLYKVFNYILYKLHTGCQWEMLPIMPSEEGSRQKENSIGGNTGLHNYDGVYAMLRGGTFTATGEGDSCSTIYNAGTLDIENVSGLCQDQDVGLNFGLYNLSGDVKADNSQFTGST
jgi:hypothetical protein